MHFVEFYMFFVHKIVLAEMKGCVMIFTFRKSVHTASALYNSEKYIEYGRTY